MKLLFDLNSLRPPRSGVGYYTQHLLEGLRDETGNVKVPGIFAAVPYCVDLIGGPYVETNADVVKAFRPKNAVRAPRQG